MNKIILIFFLITLIACAQYQEGQIYQKGRIWNYTYSFDSANGQISSGKIIMTCGKMNFSAFISGYKPIQYEYTSDNGKVFETTSVDENETDIFLHPPRLEQFAFAQVPPMPSISLPVQQKTTWTGTLTVVKAAYKKANGKKIQSKSKISGKENFKLGDKDIECWVIEGENTSHHDELGKFSCKYLFNEVYGFVKLEYFKPNNEHLTISLDEVNF